MRNGRISAVFRAIGLVVLLLIAMIGGLWAGMSLSSFLSAPDRGVMDAPY
jgi:hypothetical protein